MSPLTLNQRALYQEVAELLRQRIFSHELAPGSWIDELKLAEEMGISRTPLREAIKVLAAEGLVTMKVRRGAYVTEVSERDMREVYDLLALLESNAAAAVCTLATDAQLEELKNLHAQLEAAAQAPDEALEQFFKLNEAFHMRLLDLADNRWLKQMVLDLRKVMKLNRRGSLEKSGRVVESLQEHRDILAAVLQRNPERAVQAVKTHMANGLIAAT